MGVRDHAGASRPRHETPAAPCGWECSFKILGSCSSQHIVTCPSPRLFLHKGRSHRTDTARSRVSLDAMLGKVCKVGRIWVMTMRSGPSAASGEQQEGTGQG